MEHSIYRLDTGEIIGIAFGEPAPLEGFGWVKGHYDQDDHYVDVDGTPMWRPERPHPRALWDREGEVWILPADDYELVTARAKASLTRVEFCKRALEFNVLSPDGAKQFAKGEIPDEYVPLLQGMPNFDRDMLEIELAGSTQIDRNNEFILFVADKAGFPPELVDQLFGVEIDG